MNIGRFLPENIDEVVALEETLDAGWTEESVRRERDRPFGLQLVAAGDSGWPVIGWCCGFLVGADAELLRIAVSPLYRLKGVASALIAQFERECAEQQVSSVFLEVAEQNRAAQRLYAKFSYNQVGRRKKYYSNPVDNALVMNKIFPPIKSSK